MVLDACVARRRCVASPPTYVGSGSDVGARSAPPSPCADGRSPRCVTVIPESNAPSGLPLAWVLAVEEITAQAAVVASSRYVESFREWLLKGQLSGIFPGHNFRLEVLDHRSRRGRSLSRATTCVAAAKLELIDPLAAPTLLNHGARLAAHRLQHRGV